MGNKTKVIRDSQGSVTLFLEKLNLDFENLKDKNLILDLSSIEKVTLNDIKLFATPSKEHKKLKNSFVIVTKDLDFNKIPVKLTVVPSLQEAKDIIEMEEIERDLGF